MGVSAVNMLTKLHRQLGSECTFPVLVINENEEWPSIPGDRMKDSHCKGVFVVAKSLPVWGTSLPTSSLYHYKKPVPRSPWVDIWF